MKRLILLLCAAAMLFCGCSVQETDPNAPLTPKTGVGGDMKPYYPEEAIPVEHKAVRLENGDVQVTIHAGLLIDEFSDVLTAEQREQGFTNAVLNEDKSVTYTIAADQYDAFLTAHQERYRAKIKNAAASGAYETVIAAEANEDFTFVTTYAEGQWYSGLDGGEAIFQTAVYAIFAQAFDVDAPFKSTVVVVDEKGTELLRGNYPEDFHLFPKDD